MMIGENISHYRVISKIGEGGMGEVYLAEDITLRRKVALKVLPPSLAQDKERLSRFEQEAFAASALNHPNILTIHEFGSIGETPFLACEFIEGETLRERLQRAPLTLAEAVEIASQIVQALVAAHEARIIHRDIKPENVMLRKDGLVKVLDFGLAKLIQERNIDRIPRSEENADTLMQEQTPQQLTSPGMVMGTIAYMSPEQARGNTVDARTDIFSLGVMLYEMVMQRQPFTGETASHVIVAILEHEPPLAHLPPELVDTLRHALAKNPTDRYSSPELLTELRKVRKRIENEQDRASAKGSEPHPDPARMLPRQEATAAASEATDSATSKRQLTAEGRQGKRGLWAVALVCLLAIAGAFFAYRWVGTGKQVESIAVLPFTSERGSSDVEYLADGMTETLINSLSQLPSLNVKARSSVFRYKNKELDLKKIASELNVQTVLTGHIVQRGAEMTLNLELIDTATENVLWGHRYESKSSEIVSLQSNIARDVSGRLKSRLSGAEETKVTRTATSDPEAYQAYLKGRYYWNRRTAENLKKAIEQFKFATDRDPTYALAYSGLADCYGVLNEYAGAPTNETVPQARAFAEKALSLDGQLAEAYATLGLIADQQWQFAEAERNYKRAIELDPKYPTARHWYSIFLKDMGRYDEATAEIKRASELDPLSSVISVNVVRALLELQNNPTASTEAALKLIDLDPNFAPGHEYLGLSYFKADVPLRRSPNWKRLQG
jgi:serine/threonine-protein kinase